MIDDEKEKENQKKKEMNNNYEINQENILMLNTYFHAYMDKILIQLIFDLKIHV